MTEREIDPAPVADTPAGVLPVIAGPVGDEPPVDQDDPGSGPGRVGCRTDLRGWAGAHLHGAVRPRRRAAGRGRPPGRWC
ncbi:hypothetical protein JIG36_46655 [Actinoplanes sp. LDG1-06]|uniref:Uncharacterized protein n=1 Tax=Paractinoplanes ovalisporus TaxID=2810368 RepID=A0ABS2AT12_9ACTN|nr:hypothetical protein [Actinoplanes ovalisporus]MBM2623007.1 hypothetical protein [Actinoplanes ovalisporus]